MVPKRMLPMSSGVNCFSPYVIKLYDISVCGSVKPKYLRRSSVSTIMNDTSARPSAKCARPAAHDSVW